MGTYIKNPKAQIAIDYSRPEFGNEATLFLDIMEVEKTVGIEHVNLCTAHLKIDTSNFNQKLIANINEKALIFLYDKVLELKPVHPYVSAVRIFWGMDNKNIFPLYQPIVLNYIKTSTDYDSNFNLTNEYNVDKEGCVYSYDGKNFDVESSAKTFVDNYIRDIRFVRPQFPRFIDSQGINGDVKSQIFTFQEIFALMFVNKIDQLWVYNSIREIKHKDMIKHTIYFAPWDLSLAPYKKKDFFIGPDRFANLAHLCPPHCIKLTYGLE